MNIKFDFNFDGVKEFFVNHAKAMIITASTMIVLMIIVALIVFFAAVQGAEQVMVPNVMGKELPAAMLDMQAKELYPKIQLRFSDNASEKGTVLEQDPGPGAIVKAGRHISLVISRGAIIEKVEDYVGQNIDEVKIHLQTLFTSTVRPMVSVKEPLLYRYDDAAAGCILEQNPPAGFEIVNPLQVEFVVSKGPASEKVAVPDLTALSIRDLLLQIASVPLVFNCMARAVEAEEKPGTVVSQLPVPDAVVDAYSKTDVVIALPETQDGKIVTGIYSYMLPEYAYLLDLKLETLLPSGARSIIVAMKYPGGLFSVPYQTEHGSTLILTVGKKEVNRQEIR